MFNVVCSFVLLSVLCFLFQTASSIDFMRFRRDKYFDGYRCGPNETIFGIENSLSPVDCAKICYKNDVCYSFFYQQDSRVCYGCDGYYHHAERLPGSKYFGRYSNKCPPGWNAQSKRCYFFSSEEKSFSTAQLMCRNMGGELVEVGDETENDYLRSMSLTNAAYWIGLAKDEQRNDFVWMTTREIPKFSFWPNGNSASPSDEIVDGKLVSYNCVGYFKEADTWRYAVCADTMNYICERPLPGN